MARRTTRRRGEPTLESLEPRQVLSGGLAAARLAAIVAARHPLAGLTSSTPVVAAPAADGSSTARPAAGHAKPPTGYLAFRITNPNQFNRTLIPPFAHHVLVQPTAPVPGQVYNILFITVRNGTARTFTAADGFQVRFPGDPINFPILTGDQVWKPGDRIVFYVLTKQYYPLPSEVHSGFEFNLAGARSIGIPGPSGIFLRVRYDPANFDNALDRIVAYGPGAQGGKGPKYGLPDTAIYDIAASYTNRTDFSGYF